jgi:hypothetical protein
VESDLVDDDPILAALSGDRPQLLTERWDPMLLEVAAASLVLPRGQFWSARRPSFSSENVGTATPLVFESPVTSLAGCAVDPTYRSPLAQDATVLLSDGLLPSPASDVDPDAPPSWSPLSCSAEPKFSPRSVMDMFQVSLSPLSKLGPLETVDCQSPARDLSSFRSSCRLPTSPILPRPSTRRCRPRKTFAGPVRRSGRIRGRFAAGSPIRQQQRTLITRLGLAREGEVIGDEALDAYLDLFARPLRQQHVDVVLRLFGWQPDALPLSDEALVECMV